MASETAPDSAALLTPREREVLGLLRLGLTDAEIAERLGISLSGAKFHVSQIIGRLGVRSRYEAAAWPEPPSWMGALAPVAALWRRAGAALPAQAASVATAGSAGLFAAAVGGLALIAVLLARGGGDGSPPVVDAETLPSLETTRDAAQQLVSEPGTTPRPPGVVRPVETPRARPQDAVRPPMPAGLEPISTPTPTAEPTDQPRDGCIPEECPHGNGAMAVDCSAALPGVQASCAYPTGTRFTLQMHVVYPPEGGYEGFGASLEWTEGVLGYLHNSDRPLLDACSPYFVTGQDIPDPQPPPLTRYCLPRPAVPKPITVAGAVFQFEVRCLENGETFLGLASRDDRWNGSYFFSNGDDPTDSPIDPVLTSAHVICGPCPDEGCTLLPTPTPAPTVPSFDPGAIAVDCDAATRGVQDGCTYPAGEQFDVLVHITKAPDGGYFGIQTKLDWTQAVLSYAAGTPADEAIGPDCGVPARYADFPPLLFACVPLPRPEIGLIFTGPVLQFRYRCLQAGTGDLVLVPEAGDTQLGTYFLSEWLSPILPRLTGAHVTCG